LGAVVELIDKVLGDLGLIVQVVEDGGVDLFEAKLGTGLGDRFLGLLLMDLGVQNCFDARCDRSLDGDIAVIITPIIWVIES
jgi:hypothetical protein